MGYGEKKLYKGGTTLSPIYNPCSCRDFSDVRRRKTFNDYPLVEE